MAQETAKTHFPRVLILFFVIVVFVAATIFVAVPISTKMETYPVEVNFAAETLCCTRTPTIKVEGQYHAALTCILVDGTTETLSVMLPDKKYYVRWYVEDDEYFSQPGCH